MALCAFSGNEDKNTAVQLSFTNCQPGKGIIYLRVGNENDELIKTVKIDLSRTNDGYKLSNLAAGKYTIRCFQDLNGNERLDKNFMGIPTEPYGFANNPKIRFGPPSIQEQTFEIKGRKKLTIQMKH